MMDTPLSGPVALPPRYYGSIAYYTVVAAAPQARMDFSILYDKRMKEAHRCEIADKEGRTRLTASIGKPHGIQRATWSDVPLSPHNRWWHTHRVTLESAYGRTPFFEFYIDRFLPFLTDGVTERYPTLRALDEAIDTEIRRILLLPAASGNSEISENSENSGNSEPCGHLVTDPEEVAAAFGNLPYWQVRADRLGFIGGLSVLDLIFNLGPEAALHIRRR